MSMNDRFAVGTEEHRGTGHFKAQRLTALALVPLVLVFVASMIGQVGASHAEFSAWIKSPLAYIPLLALILTAFWHMKLGMEVIVEDYIQNKSTRGLLLTLNTFGAMALAAIAVYAVVKLVFMG